MIEKLQKRFEAIVIGTSSGGIDALETILPMLPPDFDIPVIIVIHRGKSPDNFLLKHFNHLCRLNVCEAEDKLLISAGSVYIAPPDYHLMVEINHTFSLSVDPPFNWSRPSIDILFETAAETYREKLIGVILTGANNDGSKGLAKIKKTGGLCIVQDPESSCSSQMPLSALKEVTADYILTLNGIGRILTQLYQNKEVSI